MDLHWSITYLATPEGAALVLPWVIQLIKKISGIADLNRWWLRLIVYLAGVLLMDLALIFFGWDWQMFTVNLLLGIPVFFEATGLYHAVVKELADAKKED